MGTETKQIDYRTTTAPTDWLARQVARYAKYPIGDTKIVDDYVHDFITELDGKRCKPDCPGANGQPSTSGQARLNGQLAVDCICSLLEQMTCEEAPLVAKGEFVAVVTSAGYNREQALGHYRNYAWLKLDDQHKHEFDRLSREGKNAHNWWLELSSHEACSQASKATEELIAIENKIQKELEAIMSA